jgi:hypothetical protein
MNAALKLMCADWQTGTAGGWTFCHGARMNNVYQTKALRRRHRITGNAIERINKTATKLCYFGEGVIFTATILNDGGPSNIKQRLTGLIAPLVRILGRCKFTDELCKGRVSVADTDAISEYCIE